MVIRNNLEQTEVENYPTMLKKVISYKTSFASPKEASDYLADAIHNFIGDGYEVIKASINPIVTSPAFVPRKFIVKLKVGKNL
ncbi:hypothetical protein M8332_07095 (plasmid) [Fructilactobacillus ixorae]|uniref:Phage protein n=1 Tax=Fructilactobacillus ixorae TaxID=1750535 RepID=A0ABY5C5D2_9LACO|nr:hypothetical protein [Fructilactobacillus ixorae]USS93982.1 hypothetical protein M8332_07095 [Fructilactobacillus ixorae]